MTTVEDLRQVIETTGYRRDGWEGGNAEIIGKQGVNVINTDPEPLEAMPGNIRLLPQKQPEKVESTVFKSGNAETNQPEGVTLHDLEQISQAYEAGWPLRDIAALVKMEGRKYPKFKAACAYLGIDPKARAL